MYVKLYTSHKNNCRAKRSRSYHSVRGLYFLAVVSVRNLVNFTLSLLLILRNYPALVLPSYQLKLIKLRGKLANLNHCAVPFLSRAAVNLYWYDYTFLTKRTAAQNEITCRKVRRLHFVEFIFAATIVTLFIFYYLLYDSI